MDSFVEYILSTVDKILQDSTQVEVTLDLDVLGKISKSKNVIKFDYYLPTNPKLVRSGSKGGKTDLRQIIEREGMRSTANFNKMGLLTQK